MKEKLQDFLNTRGFNYVTFAAYLNPEESTIIAEQLAKHVEGRNIHHITIDKNIHKGTFDGDHLLGITVYFTETHRQSFYLRISDGALRWYL